MVSCGGQAAWLGDGWLAGAWGFFTVAGKNDPVDLVSNVWRGEGVLDALISLCGLGALGLPRYLYVWSRVHIGDRELGLVARGFCL